MRQLKKKTPKKGSQRLDAEDFENRIGYLVRRTYNQMRSLGDQQLREVGLSTPQFGVLMALAANPDASNAELARLSLVTPQTMHGILTNLIRDGLVTREDAPAKGRVLALRLTDMGRQRIRKADTLMKEAEEALLNSHSQSERKMLISLLRKSGDLE